MGFSQILHVVTQFQPMGAPYLDTPPPVLSCQELSSVENEIISFSHTEQNKTSQKK
jgi:hypothetical protein